MLRAGAGLRPYQANRVKNTVINKHGSRRAHGECNMRVVSPTGVTLRSHVSLFVRTCRFLSLFLIFPRNVSLLTICTPPPTDPPDLPAVGLRGLPLSNVQDKTGSMYPPNVPILATFELCQGRYGVYAKCPIVDICQKVTICRFLSHFSDFRTRSGRRYPHGRRQQAVYCRPLLICSAREWLKGPTRLIE